MIAIDKIDVKIISIECIDRTIVHVLPIKTSIFAESYWNGTMLVFLLNFEIVYFEVFNHLK